MKKTIITTTLLLLSIASFAEVREVSVMTYNVQNLFDTKHDEGENDCEFLPLKTKVSMKHEMVKNCSSVKSDFYKSQCFYLDWNQKVLDKKIQQLSKVIKIANKGQSPDILVLQEVENMDVLIELANKGLVGENYKYAILIEGQNKRGIDVAMLSKFPVLYEPKLHTISQESKTTGILEATFYIDGQLLTIFGNHWPSQNSPSCEREKAAKALYKAVENNRERYKDGLVIAVGDFNTIPADQPHGINMHITNKQNKYWFHEVNIEGTYNYKGKWNRLDRIFLLEGTFSESCKTHKKFCIAVNWSDFKVIKEDFMLKNIKSVKVPYRFNPETKQGFSDHLPVIATFDFIPPFNQGQQRVFQSYRPTYTKGIKVLSEF